MLFPGIGTTVYNLLQTTKLNMQWQERKENFNKPKENDPNAEQIQRLKEMAEDSRKYNYVESLRTKLKCGDDLSPAEMDYLKANNPDLYQTALEVRQEREQYKRELENCRTQEEVDRLNTGKLNGLISQAKAVASNANIPLSKKTQLMEKIMAKVMGVQKVHTKFIQSGAYDSLPSEEETDEKRKAARKANEAEELAQDEAFRAAQRELDAALGQLTSDDAKDSASAAPKADADGEINADGDGDAPEPGQGTAPDSDANVVGVDSSSARAATPARSGVELPKPAPAPGAARAPVGGAGAVGADSSSARGTAPVRPSATGGAKAAAAAFQAVAQTTAATPPAAAAPRGGFSRRA